MIIVVEGVSAAGKTTWCRKHAASMLVRESYPTARPNWKDGEQTAAEGWTDWNAGRWAAALSMETAQGVAVCDTDPLKAHYNWCLWQIGEAPQSYWLAQLEATREAFRQQRMGFADLYLFKTIDAKTARHQRDADTVRDRSNFDLNVRLNEPLMAWYATIEKSVPGKVLWMLPDAMPDVTGIGTWRYSLEAFDTFVGSLPRKI
ncbi:hypothetical protein [Pararhizobium sp.]|uniref:hypothetical protein n=1 Tax=Pararhizobium sp. TaxID=1977563 RepID=UPI00272205C4|nr:hypothetical protein [Pararhizobium sp.]MDO9417917.1 hypothetical protein [Pararhizobium sp.]